MSSDSAVAAGLTSCLYCSLGCRAGLGPGGPGQFIPLYPEGESGDYAGLCARGSVFAELTNHRDRLLWPLIREGGACREAAMGDAARRAAETLRVATVNARPLALVDGNFDLASLAEAVAALEKLLPRERIAIDLPPEDAELLAGCETSRAEYASPASLRVADAILVVGNPFTTHPVVAHWALDLGQRRRRPLMVLDARAGVTNAYATSAAVVPPGCEHVALAAVGKALGVKGCDAQSAGVDAGQMQNWAKALSDAREPAVIVAAESGRAARWFELGLLAGEIARAAGGRLLPLTVYGNALGAVRLSARLGLADARQLGAEILESSAPAAVLFGQGMMERLGGDVRGVAAMSLVPQRCSRCDVVLPLAWAFETGGPVLLPGMGLVESEAAIAPPAGVPTLGALAAMLAGGPGRPLGDFASLAAAARQAGPNLSPLEPIGEGDGLVAVLVGDSVNFADGTLTRRVSFPRKMLPVPIVSLSTADAARFGLDDGHQAEVTAAGATVSAQVMVEEQQKAGQAVLAGAYPEVQAMQRAACAGRGPAPMRIRVKAM